MSNPIVEARATLHDALVDVFAQPIDGFQFEDRVYATKPDRIVAPCVYIGDSAGGTARGNQATTYRIAFPVWAIYDGASVAQVKGIDEVIGRLIAACNQASGANVIGHQPQPPDITNPGSLRAAVLTVEISAFPSTFRPITLMEAASA